MAAFGANGTNLKSTEEIELEDFVEMYLPAFVFMAFLSVIGIIGNIHVLLVYRSSPEMKKIAVRTFILWLAAIDLAVCVFSIPFEMFDSRHNYTFSTSPATCKFFRYVGHATVFTSNGFLTTIAIERGIITRKNYVGYTKKSTKRYNAVSCIIVVLMFLLATPILVFIGVDEIQIPEHTNITGNDCTILKKYKTNKWYMTFNTIVFLIMSICFLVVFGVYSKILFYIFSQMRKKAKKKKKTFSETSGTNQMRGNFDRGRRLTITLIIATAVSCLGNIVFLSAGLIQVTNPNLYQTAKGTFTIILFRFVFINNAVNPVVYVTADDRFRSECIAVYQRCMKRIEKQATKDSSTEKTLETKL